MKGSNSRTSSKITGYILFVLGIFFTIGALIIGLPVFLLTLFIIAIIIGIVLIRWGNKKKEQQDKQRERLDKGWEEGE
jgi:membrane protein implicated in regulation of membrane protease activity